MVPMSTQGPLMSLPSSSSTPQWKYDVFLNFRGEIRKGFLGHLHTALERECILAFRDNENLESGKLILPELFKAIQESRIAIVIFSSDYASSTWALNELVHIVKCKKEMGLVVVPIFYKVSPSEVRKQSGSFAEAFDKYENHMKESIEKVETWRSALREVANISGWDLQDRHESEFIQHIVKEIMKKLSPKFSSTTKNLVGIESTMAELIPSYLDFGNNVCIIGICGMGGLGKTTLARFVYDEFHAHFEGSSFIANVREYSKKHGLPRLQQQLLADTLKNKDIDISNVYDGVNEIKKRLCRKKVLLVIDDVNQLDQLEKLVGKNDWFGLGSWIIITTRDEHVLVQHEVLRIYKPKLLDKDDASKIFCLKAFKNEQPKEGYMQLSQEFVKYANGLPLALVTLGSFLVGRTIDDWQSQLDSLKKIKGEIFDVLKISYDGLEEIWKEIFLDIACFFIRENKDEVIQILESCGFNARIGISVLVEKSLLTIDNNHLGMHDLLQEMGEKIVRQKSGGKLGNQSRLWLTKDLYSVLQKNMATDDIQAIATYGEEDFNFEEFPEVFSKMSNLRLLIIDKIHIPNALNRVPNELRYLKWDSCSLKCLPSSFQPKELVQLDMQGSKLEYLWEGVKCFGKLKFIDLHGSQDLIRTPDFSGVSRLERLELSYCSKLVDIHPSIRHLNRLVVLDLSYCPYLNNLPSMTTEMESLTVLNLSGCSNLRKFPEFKGIMKSLSQLYLQKTAIERLPSSIECLTALTLLDLSHCENLECLPSNINSLSSLVKLILFACSKLANLPASISQLSKLELLCLQKTAIDRLPSSIECLTALTFLDLSYCKNLECLPSNMDSLRSLVELNLFACPKLANLPASISRHSKLENLNLGYCENLRSLPELPSTVRFINAQRCTSLEPSPALLRQSSMALLDSQFRVYDESSGGVAFTILNSYLQGLLCRTTGCETSTQRKERKEEFQIIIPGVKIPRWLTHQRLGNSIRIELSPNWCNSRWMGFVLCAHLAGMGDLLLMGAHVIALGDLPHREYVSEFFLTSGSEEHIWLLFLSRDDWFAAVGNGECSQIEVVFKNYFLAPPGVKKCGVSLVYKLDMEEFNQTHVITYEGWDGVHHGFDH